MPEEKICIKMDKDDLVSLVMGTIPYYSAMSKVSGLGSFQASYNTWHWDKYKLKELSVERLLDVYTHCKNSCTDTKDSEGPKLVEEITGENLISLLQYKLLRENFQKLINDVLGPNYYNEGMDVYTCDEFSCRDLKNKLKR